MTMPRYQQSCMCRLACCRPCLAAVLQLYACVTVAWHCSRHPAWVANDGMRTLQELRMETCRISLAASAVNLGPWAAGLLSLVWSSSAAVHPAEQQASALNEPNCSTCQGLRWILLQMPGE